VVAPPPKPPPSIVVTPEAMAWSTSCGLLKWMSSALERLCLYLLIVEFAADQAAHPVNDSIGADIDEIDLAFAAGLESNGRVRRNIQSGSVRGFGIERESRIRLKKVKV